MTSEATKAAIEQLSEPERRKLADWFTELEEQAWDAEIEQVFSRALRGHHLTETINEEIDKQNFTPLDDGLSSRQ